MARPQAILTVTLAGAAVAAAAFGLYRATLLPGFDLGDTASFQAEASLAPLTPRHGYPLYLTLARTWVDAMGGDPARALNLHSAVAAALACGITVAVGSGLAGTLTGGLVAALLLATSYTFWSQAVIAEVYALHILFVAGCCGTLLWWRVRPSLVRLGVFLALYALSFGHHLSMILLAPAFALFLIVSARGRLSTVVGPRPIALAIVMAGFGALQYLTSLQSLWFLPEPPASLTDGLRTFWFDLTKADWRETMVFGVHPAALADRFAMAAFDLRQQFGIAGALLAATGLLSLSSSASRTLLVLGYLIPTAFALGYNVGDVHVFFLTSHFMTALLAGCGAAAIQRALAGRASPWRPVLLVPAVLLAYPAWRAWDTFPVMDRSADRRPEQVLEAFTIGLTGSNAILAADLNWQLQNGLVYYARHHRSGLPVVRMAEHMLQAPFLIADNRSIGRDVVLSEGSRARLAAAFGPRYRMERDPRVATASLATAIASAPRGTLYVLNVLAPTRDYQPLPGELPFFVRVLTGSTMSDVPDAPYVTLAGRSGERPVLVRQSMRPFRERLALAGIDLEVRMESWLSTDTIRRAGFGHVLVNGRRVLVVERGISFVTLDPQGNDDIVFYGNNIFETLGRYALK